MDDREYFTVQETSMTIPRSGALAVFAGDKPRKNDDGTTSFSLRGPLLLMPQEMWEDAEETMRGVAKVLNENAHLFFDSAKPADLAQAPAPVRVKPLVWEVCALPRHHENKWVAGPYTIRFVEDFFLVYGWDDKFKHTSVDLDDAQAAAQADYETRILSAIEWGSPDA